MNTQKLFHRNFTLVVIGQIISLFGNAVLRFALPLYLLNLTGSSALYGTVLAFSTLPMILLSPIGGIIADRVNKRNIMVVLDFSTAALVLLFAVSMSKVNLILLMVITMMLLCGIQAAYQPAVQASIPALMEPQNILPANAVINQISSLANLLGPIIGGVLLGIWGLPPILALGIACFTLSAIMEIFIRIPFTRQPSSGNIFTLIGKDFTTSIRYIRREKPEIWKMMWMVAAFNLFLTSMLMVGYPVIITQTLGLSMQLCGYAEGALAAGGLCGGLLTGLLAKRLNIANCTRLLIAAAFCTLPTGLTLLFDMPVMFSYGVITVSCFLLMGCATMFSIQVLAYIQGNTPDYLIGKVISCVIALTTCAQPLGQGMYGFLFDAMKGQTWLIVFGAAFVSVVIAVFSRGIFRNLRTGSIPGELKPSTENV